MAQGGLREVGGLVRTFNRDAGGSGSGSTGERDSVNHESKQDHTGTEQQAADRPGFFVAIVQ